MAIAGQSPPIDADGPASGGADIKLVLEKVRAAPAELNSSIRRQLEKELKDAIYDVKCSELLAENPFED